MIWNKNELKAINKIIYSKDVSAALKDDNLVLERKNSGDNLKKDNSIFYCDLIEIFKLLLTNTDKEDIDRILTKYSKVNFDINNRLHYGLISSLSKISLNKDDKYYSQIFNIAKELVGQYERIIFHVIDESFANITDINIIKEKINNIKSTVSNEEKQVNFLMQKIFNDANGINNEILFEDIINRCNSKIKDSLLSKAYLILAKTARNNEINKIKQAKEYHDDFTAKRLRKKQKRPRKYSTNNLNYN